MRLPLGKIPLPVLEKYVLPRSGAEASSCVVGPAAGVDFAVIRLDDVFMVVSSDPVTGALKDAGWLAVNVSANDVATSGAMPRYMEAVILLPEDSGAEVVDEVASQIDQAAKALKICIVGGHTELTPKLDRPIVITTAIGLTDRYVTAGDAQAGDSILMSKTAGIEGTSVLAASFKDRLSSLGESIISNAASFIGKISVVGEAVEAFKTGYVHGMHDPTEGGVLGGVFEMALASRLGFTLIEDDVPVAPETRSICDVLKIDPLKLISSGALLMAVDPDGVVVVEEALKSIGVEVSRVGSFVEEGGFIIKAGGVRERVDEGVVDELWRLMG